MLMRTNPRKSRDDLGVGDGCAPVCGSLDRCCKTVSNLSATPFPKLSFNCVIDKTLAQHPSGDANTMKEQNTFAAEKSKGMESRRFGGHERVGKGESHPSDKGPTRKHSPKRVLGDTEERCVGVQRRRCEDEGPLFAHANVNSDGTFDWGETLCVGGDVQVFEDKDAFIGRVRSAKNLVTWKGIYWGFPLKLREEISGSIDLWACMAALQAFVPKLSQFHYKTIPPTRPDGSPSVVGQLSTLYSQWNLQHRLRYTPLNGGRYPWETMRGWTCSELYKPMDCVARAIPSPSWMDSPINLDQDTKWLRS